ncbi:MAG TPA: sigma-70 family RNA polymerase sigma factor [Stellaceae bacterium]|jgi:RNA polymerase sigma-70 factor (ECF subfamily)|nr:sigma-70 family RNA polymerase sigma factor [Stellaceae bacterium]
MVDDRLKARRFETLVMPHLDSAYNLARWLTRNDADANDVVQEACLRAFKYFDGFDGQFANAWLLKIVRNTCYTWMKQNRPAEEAMALDDNLDEIDRNESAIELNASGLGRSPESLLSARRDAQRIDALIEQLPPAFREIVILREMDDMSYREIADIVGVPIGTVMSRLARGRQMLQSALRKHGYGSEAS